MGPPPPPGGLPAKRGDDAGMSSEDDGLPRSPPEMSLLPDMGPGTTIKASAACASPRLRQHPPQRAARALVAPVCSPKIPMGGCGRARCGQEESQTRSLEPQSVLGLCLFSFFEQKCRTCRKYCLGNIFHDGYRSDIINPVPRFSCLSR